MLARLKRWLWPRRISQAPETTAFHGRLHDARQYGLAEQRAARQRTRQTRAASRDFAQTLAAPPVWRRDGSDHG